MNEINHEELKKALEVAHKIKKPLYISGTTGIGKSETIKEYAKEYAKKQGLNFVEGTTNNEKDFQLIDIRLSQLEPSDLKGLPDIKGDTTKWLKPNWLPTNPKAQGIILFDEINLAPPSIQASCYQLILDRRLDDYQIPEGFMVIGAGNRESDKANVFDLPAPLKNRFLHVDLKIPSVEEWSEWANKNGIAGEVISFLNWKKDALFKFDEVENSNAFPTPRSWYYASEVLKETRGKGNEKIRDIMLKSAIGEATAIQFKSFLKISEKVDLNEYLKNPEKVKDIDEVSIKYALIGAILEDYKNKRSKDRLEKILKLTSNLEPELAFITLRGLKNINGGFFKANIQKVPNWRAYLKDFVKYI